MARRTVILAATTLFLGLSTPRLARGTVGEQRARLPPPAKCEDPVVGTWKSHTYHEAHFISWTEFTLHVRRKAGSPTDLEGIIYNHSWHGSETDVQPPACAGDLRYVVSMDGVGTIEGNQVSFRGVGDWRLDEVLCGVFDGGYNLDHFTGEIDPELQEFQSVNNDGGISVNEPTVFRRISCAQQDLGAARSVPRPPYQPPSGCLPW